jgi:hypothetical protein
MRARLQWPRRCSYGPCRALAERRTACADHLQDAFRPLQSGCGGDVVTVCTALLCSCGCCAMHARNVSWRADSSSDVHRVRGASTALWGIQPFTINKCAAITSYPEATGCSAASPRCHDWKCHAHHHARPQAVTSARQHADCALAS